MRLVGSIVLVAAGAILILVVDGSVRGIEANTIGAVLVLIGLVSAAVMLVLWSRGGLTGPADDDDQQAVLPRR